MSCRGGGGSNGRTTPGSAALPACSTRSNRNYGCGLWPYCMYREFVMSTSVEGEGRCSKLTVEVSVPHVNCTEDVAAFVALVATMDRCRGYERGCLQALLSAAEEGTLPTPDHLNILLEARRTLGKPVNKVDFVSSPMLTHHEVIFKDSIQWVDEGTNSPF
ncbi:hypothetical protein Fmac_018551 [Flemingia macrophylla]|uniref:Uncharacterized protein n=1 Tax=Flemingia macrophylla TaxID=520843 RepID=A0ABD1M5D5_9FABA